MTHLFHMVEALNRLQAKVKNTVPEIHYLFEGFYLKALSYVENPNEEDYRLLRLDEVTFMNRLGDSENEFLLAAVMIVMDAMTAIRNTHMNDGNEKTWADRVVQATSRIT